MFQGLFNNRDQVNLEDLKEDFYGTFEATKGQLKAYFTMKKENRIFTHSSLGARALGVLLMVAPVISITVFGAFLNKADDMWMVLTVPAILFAVIGFGAFIAAYDRKDGMSKAKLTGFNLLGVVTLIISGLGILLFSSMTLGNVIPGLAVILASVIALIFTMRMKQRTKKAASCLGKYWDSKNL